MFIEYFVVGIFALRHFGVQASISITFEEATIDMIDPKYFDPKDTYMRLDKEGGDSVSARLTIIKELPETCNGHFAVFGLSMGQFIKPTGLDVAMKLCDMIEEPLLGEFFRTLGLTGKACPVQPGTYNGERYRFTPETLPDQYEENKYQTKFEILVDGKAILSARSITDVANVYDR